MRSRRTLLAGLGVVLAIVCFVALNTWGTLQLRGLRLDLTDNRQYTLSPATKQLLGGLQEPLTLRLYVSSAIQEANPFLWSYAQRVRDMLQAYIEASAGKITLELIDPEPFSVQEDRAVGFGLQPVALDNAGSVGYVGLAGTNSTDDSDVLPVLTPDREPFLEYDLTRLAFNLAEPEKPNVALIAGLPLNGDPARQYRPWQLYEQLGQFFDIRFLGGDIARLDDDVDLLMVVHPTSLSEKTLFAIDQFIMRGGKSMVFVDPHSEAAAARARTPQPGPAASSLDRLLGAYGLELEPGKVVADPAYARQVQYPSGGRQQVVDYLPWLSLTGEALSGELPITAELQRVNVASAGALRGTEGSKLELTPLLTSSDQAQLVAVEKVAAFPDPLALVRDYAADGQRHAMAVRVRGEVVPSAFPEALPEGIEPPSDRLTASRGPVDLIVVADTDMLEDRAWLAQQSMFGQGVGIPVADNANFVANALDYLAGSEALASLRGRDVTLRPFTRVEGIRRAAELQYRAKEQELLSKLADLQQKLATLQVASDDEAALSSAQQQELEAFRAQLLDTRRELREVRYALRSDVEMLQDRLRLFNILAMPLLVALIAIGLALAHRIRSRRDYNLAEA